MSTIDNVIIQVRALLNDLGIKLWMEPYYFSDHGSMEAAIDELAKDFSNKLSLPYESCKMALSELQAGALRKLAARKEFEETGIASFTVRQVKNKEGTHSSIDIKCALSASGSELQQKIAESFKIADAKRMKCIANGKIIDANKTLESQGLKNNQLLMVIMSDSNSSSKDNIYNRIRKIKEDVEIIVDSSQQLFEMEDQDGNPVYLPPDENRSILMAMSFYEKARVAIKRNNYDEALILLLEADEYFSACDSDFLNTVDNYALVNLDIVWCYLCLKNVSQLPDAARRLNICEDNFQRSYGKDMERLIALRGTAFLERALIMRLHLLQGIVLFHQNLRDQAFEKLEIAAKELRELKVDPECVEILVNMGFEPNEARIGLRAAGGNINGAMDFIYETKRKSKEARKRAEKERQAARINDDKNWVDPRKVNDLIEMGFPQNSIIKALRQTNNDMNNALNLLESNATELEASVSIQSIDDNLMRELTSIGFNENIVRAALSVNGNDIEKCLEFIFESVDTNRTDFIEKLSNLSFINMPSTSTSMAGFSDVVKKFAEKMQKEVAGLQAYNRFHKDVTHDTSEYLDMPLDEEEKFLNEYMALLQL